MKIAEYFASMSVRIDRKSIANVDKTLKNLENRLKAFTKVASKRLNLSIDIANFKVDPRRLEAALGSSLDKASNNVVFEIKRFAIDQRALRAAMLRATRATTVNAPVNQRQTPVGNQSQPRTSRSESSYGRANYLHAGGAAGALARYGVASLPFVGGVYGLGSLNKANQELVSSNISAQSVLGANSGALLDRLAERTDYLGANYRETLPQFTKFMASASPMLGQDKSFDIFQSFLQFGRTRGATDVSMNRALTAVGQMSAKGQVMAEELKNQLGDAGGFGELPQLFAEAYQIKTGGNLKGGDARAALMKAMERGEVKTADVLPIVTQLMDELSKGGIEAARNSSLAQQARAQNAIFGRGGLLQRFSEGGGETGFARMWGALAIAMKESAPIVDSLTRGFETFSRKMSSMMLLPQSIMRAFQGRDSWFGDAVGTETVDKLKSFIEGVGEVFDELKKLTDTVFEGWGMLVPAIVSFANKVKDVFLYTFKMFNALLPGGEGADAAANYGRAMQASLAGESPENVKKIAAGLQDKKTSGFEDVTNALSYTPVGFVAEKYTDGYKAVAEKTGIAAWWENFTGLMKDRKPSDGDRASMDYQREMALSRERFRNSQSNTLTIAEGAIVINAPTGDAQELSETLMATIRKEAAAVMTVGFENVKVSYPNTGG